MTNGGFQVHNVVATFSLTPKVKMLEIKQIYGDYCILRKGVADLWLPYPGCKLRIYKTGKVVCEGAESPATASAGAEVLVKKLCAKGITVSSSPVSVKNLFVTAKAEGINAPEIAKAYKGKLRVSYENEPGVFPGGPLVVRGVPDSKSSSVHIFSSGAITCTGCRSVEEAKGIISYVCEKLGIPLT